MFMRSSVYQRIIKSVKSWPKRGHVLGQQSQKIYNTMTGKKKSISRFGIENHKLEKDKFIYSDRFEGLADLKKKPSMVI